MDVDAKGLGEGRVDVDASRWRSDESGESNGFTSSCCGGGEKGGSGLSGSELNVGGESTSCLKGNVGLMSAATGRAAMVLDECGGAGRGNRWRVEGGDSDVVGFGGREEGSEGKEECAGTVGESAGRAGKGNMGLGDGMGC